LSGETGVTVAAVTVDGDAGADLDAGEGDGGRGSVDDADVESADQGAVVGRDGTNRTAG
jgi:hypothetical protein